MLEKIITINPMLIKIKLIRNIRVIIIKMLEMYMRLMKIGIIEEMILIING